MQTLIQWNYKERDRFEIFETMSLDMEWLEMFVVFHEAVLLVLFSCYTTAVVCFRFFTSTSLSSCESYAAMSSTSRCVCPSWPARSRTTKVSGRVSHEIVSHPKKLAVQCFSGDLQNIADVFTARFTSVCARLGHVAGDLDGVFMWGVYVWRFTGSGLHEVV